MKLVYIIMSSILTNIKFNIPFTYVPKYILFQLPLFTNYSINIWVYIEIVLCILRLSDAMLDWCLMKDETEKKFASYWLTYIYSQYFIQNIKVDNQFLFIQALECQAYRLIMKQKCHFLVSLPSVDTRLRKRLIDLGYHVHMAFIPMEIVTGVYC